MAFPGIINGSPKTRKEPLKVIITTVCGLLLGLFAGLFLSRVMRIGVSYEFGYRVSNGTEIVDTEIFDTEIFDTGIADTGIADTGIADTGIANTGIVDTGIADTKIVDPGNIVDNEIGDTEIGDTEIGDTGFCNPAQVSGRPRGTEGLPAGIIVAETDLYQRRLFGDPSQDLPEQPSKYLVTLTVGINQKQLVNMMVSRFPKNWTFMLFHYDGNIDDWNEFEWSRTAIHVSAPKQTKWWFAKRFLHPDVVAPYDYIFIWDEDLDVQHFHADRYVELVRKHGLEISQPSLTPNKGITWEITKRQIGVEVHKTVVEKPGWCTDNHLPPCSGFIEIMAPVFSGSAWRCVWHMIQNDLVHGWGVDLHMHRCVEPSHEKIGVVDAEWITHRGVPTLGNQGTASAPGEEPWQGVRQRCRSEMKLYNTRIADAIQESEEVESEKRSRGGLH